MGDVVLYLRKNKNSETGKLLEIFSQFGRVVDINISFNEFSNYFQEKYPDKNLLNGAFLNSVNELRFCGLISESKKRKNWSYEKHFFAKTVF